jgi:hypothetical protein
MSRKNLFQFILVIAFGLFLMACNKENNGPPLSDRGEILTSRAWIALDLVISDSTGNDSSIFRSCMQDDKLSFEANHDFSFSAIDTVCDSAGLFYGEGIWAFDVTQDSIALKYNDTTRYFGVDTLTKELLQLGFGDSIDHHFVKIRLSFQSVPKE